MSDAEHDFLRLLRRPASDPAAFVEWGVLLARRATDAARRMESLRRTASSPVHRAVAAGVHEGVRGLVRNLEAWRTPPAWHARPAAQRSLLLLLRWAHLAERAANENSLRDTADLARALAHLERDGGYGGGSRALPFGAVSAALVALKAGGALGLYLQLGSTPFDAWTSGTMGGGLALYLGWRLAVRCAPAVHLFRVRSRVRAMFAALRIDRGPALPGEGGRPAPRRFGEPDDALPAWVQVPSVAVRSGFPETDAPPRLDAEGQLRGLFRRRYTDPGVARAWGEHLAQLTRDAAARLERLGPPAASNTTRALASGLREEVEHLLGRLGAEPPPEQQRTLLLLLRWAALARLAARPTPPADPGPLVREFSRLRRESRRARSRWSSFGAEAVSCVIGGAIALELFTTPTVATLRLGVTGWATATSARLVGFVFCLEVGAAVAQHVLHAMARRRADRALDSLFDPGLEPEAGAAGIAEVERSAEPGTRTRTVRSGAGH